MEVHIGIPQDKRIEIAKGLSHLLADTYTLYIKTHNYHWNVTGPMFQTLHKMFEEQYMELAEAVDEIAERIRALGEFAPGSYAQFKELSSVKEETGVPKAMDMVKDLVDGHEAVIKTARKIIDITEEVSDEGTLDILTTRIQAHEKTAWMLRSMAE